VPGGRHPVSGGDGSAMKRALFEDEHEWFRESVATFVDRELIPNRERFREQR